MVSPNQFAHDLLKETWDGKLPVDPFALAQAHGIEVFMSFSVPTGSGYKVSEDNSLFVDPYTYVYAPVQSREACALGIGEIIIGERSEEFVSCLLIPDRYVHYVADTELAKKRFAVSDEVVSTRRAISWT